MGSFLSNKRSTGSNESIRTFWPRRPSSAETVSADEGLRDLHGWNILIDLFDPVHVLHCDLFKLVCA